MNDNVNKATTAGLSSVLRDAAARLREVFAPEGLNIGMNLGSAAGAGMLSTVRICSALIWLRGKPSASIPNA